MNNKLDTKTALTDVITIIASYFIMLFIIAFLNMNPISKTKDIDSIDRFLINLEWDDKNSSDYDLWIMDASGDRIGYSNKNGRISYLDRDDLGTANDKVIINGQLYEIDVNRETIFIRQSVDGRYYISVHCFNKNGQPDATITVTVVDIRAGAREIARKVLNNFESKEEKFVLSFEIVDNVIVDIDYTTPFSILSAGAKTNRGATSQ